MLSIDHQIDKIKNHPKYKPPLRAVKDRLGFSGYWAYLCETVLSN